MIEWFLMVKNRMLECGFNLVKGLITGITLAGLAGCSTFPGWLPSSGPSKERVVQQKLEKSPIAVINVTSDIAHRLLAAKHAELFSKIFSHGTAPDYVIGPGDVLEVSVWESPPAVLFGTAVVVPRAGVTGTHQITFPQQIVGKDGAISIPFAGVVIAAGKTPRQISAEIAQRLSGKANHPQVQVRVIRNVTQTVTVVGEVAKSMRMPLTPKGERLLDAIAAAGGVRQPVGKVTLQLSRRGKVASMPMEQVIQDPEQNIYLQPGDVVTAMYKPFSFTVLGAAGRNAEIDFEAKGITLAQALGRMAGLRDALADAEGLFLFRFEDPSVLPDKKRKAVAKTPEGKVPVVYRLNLKDPRAFLVAQSFPMRNRDVIYVANAPATELQKFLNILTSSIFTATGISNLGR